MSARSTCLIVLFDSYITLSFFLSQLALSVVSIEESKDDSGLVYFSFTFLCFGLMRLSYL